MSMNPDENFLQQKLDERNAQHALRQLKLPSAGMADFCSNDYLGIVKNKLLESGQAGHAQLAHGSTGSRLLSGNYVMIEETEKKIAAFHEAASGLFFNSGYDANLALLSSIPQRSDTVIYDYLSHASLRDGIRLSGARAFSFRHNDMDDLGKKLKEASGNIFVVTESVFSMDGDVAPLQSMFEVCKTYNAHVVVDEAHATGVIGNKGEGLVQQQKLQEKCFARIHTFGKACGTHGAIVLGSETLRNYLINFSRPLIYTTALPPSSVAAVSLSYDIFPRLIMERKSLEQNIDAFSQAKLKYKRLESATAIQGVIIPGNDEVKKVASFLQESGLDVRPILYPSVPKGAERLRIVLHAFNTAEEMSRLISCLS